MVGRKEALRTLPVFLALNLACTNGVSTHRAVLSVATPGTRDVALDERLDGNPRRKPLLALQKNGAVSDRILLRVRGGVSRPGAKDKKKEFRLYGSPVDRALVVNGISWAAVVGGVLWSKTKMGPEEGVCHIRRRALTAQCMVATHGLGENIMHIVAVWVPFRFCATGSPYTAGGTIL